MLTMYVGSYSSFVSIVVHVTTSAIIVSRLYIHKCYINFLSLMFYTHNLNIYRL